MKRGKKYLAAAALIEKGKVYSLEEAVVLCKKTNIVKFDSTLDLSFNLGVDPRQADQQIRGTMVLPNGNGKTKKVLAITNNTAAATEAGADIVGGKEMVEKIKIENWFDYDVIVATPDMMGEIGKIARLLGPKGLMPNPKVGTVSPDIAKAISDIKAGKVEYRVDKEGNIHVSVAKVSFDDAKIIENVVALCDAIVKAKPAASKGTYVKNAVMHTTMGPSIPFAVPNAK